MESHRKLSKLLQDFTDVRTSNETYILHSWWFNDLRNHRNL